MLQKLVLMLVVLKLAHILWGDGYLHLPFLWSYFLIGLIGLLGISSLSHKLQKTLNASLLLVIASITILELTHFREKSAFESGVGAAYPIHFLGFALLVALFLKQRSWLKRPPVKFWLLVPVGFLLSFILAVLAFSPVLAVVFQHLVGNSATLQLAAQSFLERVLVIPIAEELARLGLHLLGLGAILSSLLFAAAHFTADPEGVRLTLMQISGSVGDSALSDSISVTLQNESMTRLLAFTSLLRYFLTGLIFYYLLVRSGSILPPLVLHILLNAFLDADVYLK